MSFTIKCWTCGCGLVSIVVLGGVDEGQVWGLGM